jgi:hypothetical protein
LKKSPPPHRCSNASSYPGSFWENPGIGWSRDSTKINCPGVSGKVSNYMLPQKTLNFEYQEWDFRINSSKCPLASILYLCLLLNYKSTVVFYQQSSQETNKMYTLNFEVGYSLTNIGNCISNWSVVNVCTFSLLSVPNICH